MEPWYAPLQIAASLGITGPLFIYYAWRMYSSIVEYHHSFISLKNTEWVSDILADGWNSDELGAQLALNSVFLKFDKKLGAIRRSLKADVYIIILVGFVGTLLGMIGSFTTLLMSVGSKGLDPAVAISTLIRGGLSTALVSSLIASIMATFVMAYLSFTEKNLVELRGNINEDCLKRYREKKEVINDQP